MKIQNKEQIKKPTMQINTKIEPSQSKKQYELALAQAKTQKGITVKIK